MLNQPFYHESIRKCTVGIGAMFNDIHLITTNDADVQVKDRIVPLAYAVKQHYYAKTFNTQQQNDGVANIEMTLPRASFALTGLSMALERKTSSLNEFKGAAGKILNSIPWDFTYTVSIYAKNTEDIIQIIEQILPTFTPTYNLVINDIPDMGIVRDVQVRLDDVGPSEDNYESGFETNRIIAWDINLTVMGNLYPSIKYNPGTGGTQTIESVKVAIWSENTMTKKLEDLGIDVIPAPADIVANPVVV